MKKTLFSIFIVLMSCSMQAQRLDSAATSSLLKGLSSFMGEVSKTDDVSANSLVGTWSFDGIAIQLESDDILKKAAGEVAAGKIEEKLDEYCQKYGLSASSCTFTFNSDSTFTNKTPKATLKGKYSVCEGNKLTLTYTTKSSFVKSPSVSGTLKKTAGSISILWNADKMMDMFITLTSKSSNTTLQGISSLVKEFDGLSVGIELKKE